MLCVFSCLLDPLRMSQRLQNSPFQHPLPSFFLHSVSQGGLLGTLCPLILEDTGAVEALCHGNSRFTEPKWSFCLASPIAQLSTPISSPFHSVIRARTNVYLDKTMCASAWHGSLPYISTVQRLRQEGREFKAGLRYILRPGLKNKKRTKPRVDDTAQLV